MDTTGNSFHIYYRMQGTTGTPSPRDHIIKDGEALCNYGVSVPDEDSLKPVSDMSKSEWAIHTSNYSNLCGECAKGAEYHDLIPDDLPEESPKFRCPICDGTAEDVNFVNDMAWILHEPHDTSSFPPSSETHKIPREQYDVWRTAPEEPFSYPKLKRFIDNYPRVFRREEYFQAKREAYFRNKD